MTIGLQFNREKRFSIKTSQNFLNRSEGFGRNLKFGKNLFNYAIETILDLKLTKKFIAKLELATTVVYIYKNGFELN